MVTGDLVDLLAQARQAYQQRALERSEALCRQILLSEPVHAAAHNLLGLVLQAGGRHQLAVEAYARAIAIDDGAASYHFNIAHSYLTLNRRTDTAAHFKRAIALTTVDFAVENFVMQNPVIAECARQVMARSRLPVSEPFFGKHEITALANDILLRCAMQTTLLRGLELEYVLTHARFVLLSFAISEKADEIPEDVVSFFCALAEQCFINEYVHARSEVETQRAQSLRDRLSEALRAGKPISPIQLAAVGAYFPLHSLPGVKSLLDTDHMSYVTDLLACQVLQPLDEAEDRKIISALTAIDNSTSLQVMSQYEENPYPRWTVTPRIETSQIHADGRATEILVAGCGTGRHALEVAQQSPNARILGIDISRSSLGYARRKSREAGFRNVEFAQADILKLGSIGRPFDHIEAIGVLHHLADPEAGLRVLLSLLKPEGTLRLGLYSETARRDGAIVEARDLITSGGYQPTPEGIRLLRLAIIARRNEPRWQKLLTMSTDFYSMSGCRDLLFHVMEHRYAIPQIAQILKAHNLSLIDFQIDPVFIEQFRYQFSSPDAAINLDQLHAFEQANPQAFRRMYMFTVRKNVYAVDEAHYQQR